MSCNSTVIKEMHKYKLKYLKTSFTYQIIKKTSSNLYVIALFCHDIMKKKNNFVKHLLQSENLHCFIKVSLLIVKINYTGDLCCSFIITNLISVQVSTFLFCCCEDRNANR